MWWERSRGAEQIDEFVERPFTIEMIDEIQGPPRWHGPDVLLRQTSFRALAEPRTFREPSSRASDFVKPMIPAFDAP